MTIHSIYTKISASYRRKRFERFRDLFVIDDRTRILDVGGYPWIWEGLQLPTRQITILNPHRLESVAAFSSRYDLVVGDGCHLPFADKAFDIVYSNSVIEHVGEPETQARFAAEASRVGRGLWVQTPAKEFPIEPHMLTPAIHWLPESWQRAMLPYAAIRSWFPDPARPSWDALKALYNEIELFTKRRFASVFPDAEVLVERFAACWPKSYIAYRAPSSA